MTSSAAAAAAAAVHAAAARPLPAAVAATSSALSAADSRCKGVAWRAVCPASSASPSERCLEAVKGSDTLSSAACSGCATWPLLPNRHIRRRRRTLRSSSSSVVVPQASFTSYPDYADSAGSRGAGIRSESTWTPMVSHLNDVWSISQIDCPPNSYTGPVAQGQGPPPMLQERFQSVISQLFQYRIIRCGGAVDDDMANLIVAQLLYLDAVDPKKARVVSQRQESQSTVKTMCHNRKVETQKGPSSSTQMKIRMVPGMAIFDTMRHIRPDVSTVCVGLAASMGAFLLSGGTKGKRYSLPNSRIMIHQPLGGAQGQQTDIEIQANEILHHKANLNGYLAYHTGQPLEKIVQDTDRDFFMSAKEAVEYGLIDQVISNPLKALQLSAAAPPAPAAAAS
ncbi:hypothetical protein CBR_g45224 [Chara braunii]|uniref:ATP-dependent Clp protease proteolytic subunit n=1 Tax=Chara braunii TaxID=69332 RepID=A0A388K3A2_CHABU|nr:hypothetical protein CBR_g45224 [Chara braunii]|eukprot:GBG64528.1 hypothetical protein CBR_g45224 [Chara braunii]